MSSENDILNRVIAVLKTVGKLDDSKTVELTHDIYQDLGIQSTAALDLLLSLEDEFNIAIPDEEFGEARLVSQLVELVDSLS